MMMMPVLRMEIFLLSPNSRSAVLHIQQLQKYIRHRLHVPGKAGKIWENPGKSGWPPRHDPFHQRESRGLHRDSHVAVRERRLLRPLAGGVRAQLGHDLNMGETKQCIV